jgi:hypothetical protein
MLMKALGKIFMGSCIGVGTVAVVTKPTNDSFGIKIAEKENNIFKKWAIIQILNEFTLFEDYGFFKIARLSHKEEKFVGLGIFNEWYEIKNKE